MPWRGFSREPEVIGSDDGFYVGRLWDEASGFVAPVIGPKMQMPGTEPIVVIGRNRSGKDAGIVTIRAARVPRSAPRTGLRSARLT